MTWTSVTARLDDVFNTFYLNRHVRDPTRTGHSCDLDQLLDVVVTDASLDVTGVVVDVAGHVPDHTDHSRGRDCPRYDIIGHIGDGFYGSKDPTNSVKALKGEKS